MWFLPKMTMITLQFEALTAINHKTPFFGDSKLVLVCISPLASAAFATCFTHFAQRRRGVCSTLNSRNCISILYAKPFFWMLFLLCMLIQRLLLLLVAPVIIMSTECDDAR